MPTVADRKLRLNHRSLGGAQQPRFNNGRSWDHYDEAPPFVKSPRGVLWHRPVAVAMLVDIETGDELHEVCIFYCQNSAFEGDGKREPLWYDDEPPKDGVLCKRCELAAIGAGKRTADEIVGRHVHIGGVRVVQYCCEDE